MATNPPTVALFRDRNGTRPPTKPDLVVQGHLPLPALQQVAAQFLDQPVLIRSGRLDRRRRGLGI